MKEITVTYTLEVTEIHSGIPDYATLRARKYTQPQLERSAKKDLSADDVHVRDLKVFIRDV